MRLSAFHWTDRSCWVCAALMDDSQPRTRTGRVASQLTETDSPKPTTTLEGLRIREQPSPDTDTHSSSAITKALPYLIQYKQSAYYVTLLQHTEENHKWAPMGLNKEWLCFGITPTNWSLIVRFHSFLFNCDTYFSLFEKHVEYNQICKEVGRQFND